MSNSDNSDIIRLGRAFGALPHGPSGRVPLSHVEHDRILRALRKRFPTEESAIEYFTRLRWPVAVACPRCASVAEWCTRSRRLPLWQCRACACQFTATVGTVMHHTMLPLRTWLFALHLMASDESVTVRYMQKSLEIAPRTAWFLSHRIRAAMRGMASVEPSETEDRRRIRNERGHAKPKHLSLYADELTFKRSMRGDREAAVVAMIRNMIGKRLTLFESERPEG